MSPSRAPRPAGSILERNLELLLTRAYVPVTPSSVFRERLARALEQAIAARARPEPRRLAGAHTERVSATRTWTLRAAAALVCVALGALAWKLTSTGRTEEDRAAAFERIAALGHTAVSTDARGDVRDVADEEAARGLDFSGPSLTAWTGTGSDLSVWLGAAGRLTAHPSTRIQAQGAPREDLSFDLERGSIVLERYATGGTWRVVTREGTLALERGTLLVALGSIGSASREPGAHGSRDHVARGANEPGVRGANEPGSRGASDPDARGASDPAYAPSVTVLLRSGSAYLEADGRRIALGLDIETELRSGHLFAVSEPLDGASAASTRAPLGDPHSDRASETASAPRPAATLRGVVTCPPDTALPETYAITLLRDERLPMVAQAEVHKIDGARREFTLTDLRPGTYTVFAEVPGFAVWQRRGIEIQAEARANPPSDAQTASAVKTSNQARDRSADPASAGGIAIVLQRGQRVSGRVIDAESGRPIEGAVVISQRDAPTQLLPLSMERAPEGWIAATVSAPDGSFDLEALSVGSHRLRATHSGFGAAWSEAIDVRAGVAHDDIEIRLQRGGAVFGHVAHKDGTAWSSAMLIASRIDYDFEQHCMSYGTATSDAEGAYAIEDLPAGPYAVLNALEPSVEHVLSPHVTQVNVTPGGRFEVDFAIGRKGTQLSGRIRAAAATAFAGLDVILEPHGPRPHERKWQSERARADGTFRFVDLPSGSYDVYVSEEMGKSFVLEDVVDVPAVPDFAYELRLGTGEIRGRVVDAVNGDGLANAVLVLEIERPEVERPAERIGGQVFAGRAVTDAEGRYALRRLPAGTYRLTAIATTGRFGPESLENIRVNATEPTLAADIRLAAGAALEVKVVGADARPIQGAGVTLIDENGRALQFTADDVTDAQGKFSLNGIKPGRWKISVTHPSWRSNAATIDLEAGAERSIEIVMPLAEAR